MKNTKANQKEGKLESLKWGVKLSQKKIQGARSIWKIYKEWTKEKDNLNGKGSFALLNSLARCRQRSSGSDFWSVTILHLYHRAAVNRAGDFGKS